MLFLLIKDHFSHLGIDLNLPKPLIMIFKHKTKIKILPRILMIHLKRFTNAGEKLKNPVIFPEKFSINEENLSIFSPMTLTALFNNNQKNQ